VLSAVVGDPFYSEMRTRQQLGYIVQGNAFEDERSTVALFLIQSGEYPADELERRAEAFIQTLPRAAGGRCRDEAWATIVAGVRARLLERDKAIAERAMRCSCWPTTERADWARTAGHRGRRWTA
jgi:insulysin